MSVKKQSRPQKQNKTKTAPVAQAEPVEETVEMPSEPVEQADPLGPPPPMAFDDAVKLGKDLAANFKFWEIELGRLADRVEPKYGDKTLERFAEEIDVPFATLSRCLSVYRAYKGTEIEGTSLKFAVAQALQAVPDRVSILQANPEMTTAQARGIARANKAAKKEPAGSGTGQQKERWIVTETRRWFDDAVDAARKTFKFGHPAQERLDPDVLRAAVEDLDQLVAALRESATATTTLADAIEEARANRTAPTVPPEPMWDDAKPEPTPADATLEPAE